MHDDMMDLDNVQQEKRQKLRRMRFIATGLLVTMTIIYFVCKRFETNSILISSIAAFAQAAMIGALADWFAVTALFKHPLGMSWIPHTAIIQKNKDKIGESLASFIVSNFFTEEVIKGKLKSINFFNDIISYIENNKGELSEKLISHLPVIVEPFLNSEKLYNAAIDELKKRLRRVELYPLVQTVVPAAISSEMHIPMIKELLKNTYKWVHNNRVKTLEILEGVDKKLTLPFVGDILYKYIDRALLKLIEDIENGVSTQFNREILHNLPAKLLRELEISEDIKLKTEKMKEDILESEQFNRFIEEKALNIKAAILSYNYNSNTELAALLSGTFSYIINELLGEESTRERVEEYIRSGISSVVCTYRQEIAELISGTVKNWPMDDMVEKLEVQVGGDLQYIRINGTIIGGIAGLIIHLLSYI
jgi:uncharacterized membrane-anchored protein YjiN (DUF445 family)